MTANFMNYGAFLVDDFKEGGITRATSALQSVDLGKQPHLPVPKEARAAIAKASPTFAPMEVMLRADGALGAWGNPSCATYPNLCGDIAGGWFPWALRDATARLGYYGTPSLAAEAFSKIGAEVEQACAAGQLPCRAGGIAQMPPLTIEQWLDLRHIAQRVAEVVFFLRAPPRWVDEKPTAPSKDPKAAAYWNMLDLPGTYIDHLSGHGAQKARAGALMDIYNMLAPAIEALGLVAILVASWKALRARRLSPVYIAAVSAWVLVGTRILLLALIDLSSFPAANFLYASPGIYMALLAGLLSLGALRPEQGEMHRMGSGAP